MARPRDWLAVARPRVRSADGWGVTPGALKIIVALLVTIALALTSTAVGGARTRKAADNRGGTDQRAGGAELADRRFRLCGQVLVEVSPQPAAVGHRNRLRSERNGADGRLARGQLWPPDRRHGDSQSAPSLDPSTDVPSVDGLLDHGWEVVATDYQGESNPNLAPTTRVFSPMA